MAGHRCLASHLYEVPKHGRSGNSNLSDDDAALAQLHIMPNLNKIIDTSAGTDDRILYRPPIHCGIRADFYVIAN
jgi:hypothetical protein